MYAGNIYLNYISKVESLSLQNYIIDIKLEAHLSLYGLTDYSYKSNNIHSIRQYGFSSL
jgi:hypothetical protein